MYLLSLFSISVLFYFSQFPIWNLLFLFLSIFFLSLIPLNLNLHSSIFFSSHLVTHHLKYHHKLRFVFPPLSLFLSWYSACLRLSVYPNRLSVVLQAFHHFISPLNLLSSIICILKLYFNYIYVFTLQIKYLYIISKYYRVGNTSFKIFVHTN